MCISRDGDHEIYWEAASLHSHRSVSGVAGLYFLLQTRWGAEHISAWFPRIATIIWPSGRWITVFPRISYRAGERHVWS